MKKSVILVLFLIVFLGAINGSEWSNGSDGNMYSLSGLNYFGLSSENITLVSSGVCFPEKCIGFSVSNVIYGLNNSVHLTIEGKSFTHKPSWTEEGTLKIYFIPLPYNSSSGRLDQTFFLVSLLDNNSEAIFTSLVPHGDYFYDPATHWLEYNARLMLLGRDAEIYEGHLRLLLFDYNSTFNNSIFIFNYSHVYLSLDAYNVNDNDDQRISSLETWKNSLTHTFNNLILSVTGLVTMTDDHEHRLIALENNFSSSNGSLPHYLRYLSASERRRIVCGYAGDNRFNHLEDLGFSCDLTYRLSRKGLENVNCRCKSLT